MTARRPPRDPGSRAAAWITGTGAFLLVAAAAVFVWVQWSRLPLEAKIAIVGGVTGAVLLTGARLRDRLPIASAALLHLGAFLLPVDLAALTRRLDVAWPRVAVAEGVLVLAAFPLLGRLGGSRLLRWSTLGGAVLLATGAGALGGIPAPVTLAVAAVVVLVVESARPLREPYAAGLAILAAVGPLVAWVAGEVTGRVEVVTSSGWVGATSTVLAVAPGVLALGVLGVSGTQRRSRLLVMLALLAPLTAVASLLLRTEPSRSAVLIQAPLLLVLVEGLALAGARDLLWRVPTERIAIAAEVVAALTLPAALTAALTPTVAELAPAGSLAAAGLGPDAAVAAAWVVASLGAAVAVVRRALRMRELWLPGALAAGVLAAAGGAAATADPFAPALVLAATAAVAIVLGGEVGAVAGGIAGVLAVAAVVAHPVGVLPVTALVAGAGTGPVIAGLRRDQPGSLEAVAGGVTALAAVALATLLPTAHVLPDPVMVAVFPAACLGLALAVDRDQLVADTARVAVLATTLAVLTWEPADAVLPLLVAAVLLSAETLRTGRPWLVVLAAVPVHHALVVLGVATGLSWAVIGLWLVGAGVVWAACSLAAPDRWRRPLLAVAATAAVAGWGLAATEQRSAGVATLVIGAAAVAHGLLTRERVVGHVGGALVTLGTWVLLDDVGVDLIEAYVAPVAAHLLGAGLVARQRDRDLSSWVAYAPAILVLAAPAFTERLGGGSGGHALVVGAVGVLALTAGAVRRLAAPLVLGVLLLVAVTLHEAFAVVASVPTWAWLAVGGSVLLGAGVALERTGTSPAGAGRRLVSGFSDRFV